ncbi:MAG: hypothetical protein HC834_06930, partial [Rhodospirillales bacterium]|nr:hypothetical protein [Rhodospirillales bacterium]
MFSVPFDPYPWVVVTAPARARRPAARFTGLAAARPSASGARRIILDLCRWRPGLDLDGRIVDRIVVRVIFVDHIVVRVIVVDRIAAVRQAGSVMHGFAQSPRQERLLQRRELLVLGIDDPRAAAEIERPGHFRMPDGAGRRTQGNLGKGDRRVAHLQVDRRGLRWPIAEVVAQGEL